MTVLSRCYASLIPRRIIRSYPESILLSLFPRSKFRSTSVRMTTNSDENKFTVMDADGWRERWKVGQIGFHKTDIHPMLQKHVGKLINGRENVRVFFPMCGKALDMKWLADQGHIIVGVECSEMALQDFFKEQELEYKTESLENLNGKVYRSADGRISLYCCDIYDFNKDVEGQFGAIWDRGALVAINREDRVKYTDLTKSLMAPDCQYLLDTFDYNEQLYAGPPHYVPEEQIHTLFGDNYDIKQVDFVDSYEEKHKGWGLDYMNERLHLITLKQT